MIFSRIISNSKPLFTVNKHNLNDVLSTSTHLLGPLYLFPKCKTRSSYSAMKVNSHVRMQPDSQRSYQVVVAATRDMGIGKNCKLPWNLPSDLKFFKKLTMSTSDPTKKNAVIMGRKTWQSIPSQYRPLPGRLNVVLTRSTTSDVTTSNNFMTCNSIPSALERLAESPYSLEIEKVFVIGGGQVLREAMNGPLCEAIHMTEVDANIDCDTFIPPVDIAVFRPWYSSLPVTENDLKISRQNMYSFVAAAGFKLNGCDLNQMIEMTMEMEIKQLNQVIWNAKETEVYFVNLGERTKFSLRCEF